MAIIKRSLNLERHGRRCPSYLVRLQKLLLTDEYLTTLRRRRSALMLGPCPL